MSHADEIRAALRLRAYPVGKTGIAIIAEAAARSPLEDAAQDMQTAVADFYVLIHRATTHSEISNISTVLSEVWQLVDACERTARRKCDTL